MDHDKDTDTARGAGLGPTGISLDIDRDGRRHLEQAAEIEDLGYSALWVAGGQLDTLGHLGDLLRATGRVAVAPSIVPTGVYPAADVAAIYHTLERDHPGRLQVGLGGRQEPRALDALARYLDELDAASVPAGRRILAALGPRKLELARERFAGAVTLLTTPGFTAGARAALGPGRALAVGVTAVLTDDPVRARGAAREMLGFLSRVPGYAANFRRMGFSDTEIDTLADRLVDALVVWGGPDDVAERVAAHRRAGADHVYLGALGGDDGLPGAVELARAVTPGPREAGPNSLG